MLQRCNLRGHLYTIIGDVLQERGCATLRCMRKVIVPPPPYTEGLLFADQMMSFPSALRDIGVPQEEICERLGVDRVTLYRWQSRLYAPHLIEVVCTGHLWAEHARQQRSRS